MASKEKTAASTVETELVKLNEEFQRTLTKFGQMPSDAKVVTATNNIVVFHNLSVAHCQLILDTLPKHTDVTKDDIVDKLRTSLSKTPFIRLRSITGNASESTWTDWNPKKSTAGPTPEEQVLHSLALSQSQHLIKTMMIPSSVDPGKIIEYNGRVVTMTGQELGFVEIRMMTYQLKWDRSVGAWYNFSSTPSVRLRIAWRVSDLTLFVDSREADAFIAGEHPEWKSLTEPCIQS